MSCYPDYLHLLQMLMVREVEPQVSELETAIREACKLSKRKQKRVVEFIGVIAGKGR